MNVVRLEGREYNEIDIINYKNNRYAILSYVKDNKDIMVRKIVEQADGEYYETLDTDDEITNVLMQFAKKNKIHF